MCGMALLIEALAGHDLLATAAACKKTLVVLCS